MEIPDGFSPHPGEKASPEILGHALLGCRIEHKGRDLCGGEPVV